MCHESSADKSPRLLLLGAAAGDAALFRLPMLGEVPNGLFLDEASRGYDAYALLVTGADQYGVPLAAVRRGPGRLHPDPVHAAGDPVRGRCSA